MKTVVFDNAGTILRRVTVLKNMITNKIIYETNTVDMVNKNSNFCIVVLQTPTSKILKEEGTIYKYLKNNKNLFEISYSQKKINKEDILNSIKYDKTAIYDIETTAKKLINKYNIEICSGTAIIVDVNKNRIEYIYTSGGLFFNKTKSVINNLQNNNIELYIASGDNKSSLNNIAKMLNISSSNIYDTLNSEGKKKLVQNLRKKGQFVYMIGNNYNDKLAIEEADIGILTLEQNEKISQKLVDLADYTIIHIEEILEIIKK